LSNLVNNIQHSSKNLGKVIVGILKNQEKYLWRMCFKIWKDFTKSFKYKNNKHRKRNKK